MVFTYNPEVVVGNCVMLIAETGVVEVEGYRVGVVMVVGGPECVCGGSNTSGGGEVTEW